MMDKNIFIHTAEHLADALKKLDLSSKKTLLVVDEQRTLLGTLSDGDIRRSILAGLELHDPIDKSFNPSPTFFHRHEYSLDTAKKTFVKKQIELIPILDEARRVVDYVTWEGVFKESAVPRAKGRIDVPVVIMAGGRGSRLAPFTHVLPKPLIPIGEKTILEHIIEEFLQFGVTRFYFTVNYRGEMIKAYFDSLEKSYTLDYLWEKEFCGTAGSLSLLPADMGDEFIVSNCDIIVKADYADILAFHRKNNADLTVVSSIQHYVIPYGIVEFKSGGEVTGIKEKPEYSFPINTGFYVISKKCLPLIPPGKMFHMTDLIAEIIHKQGKVFMYPVNEKEYVDIGQWEEYQKVMDTFYKNGQRV